MSGTLLFLLTFVAAIGCGVTGGVFFAFSAFVMAALARLPRNEGIAAMQSINVVVLNPVFFTAFLGTALVCLVLPVLAVLVWPVSIAWHLVAGAGLYLVGCILVTMAFNVPLNNRLASISSDSAEGAGVWKDYCARWTAWNHVRTAACVAAMALFIAALL